MEDMTKTVLNLASCAMVEADLLNPDYTFSVQDTNFNNPKEVPDVTVFGHYIALEFGIPFAKDSFDLESMMWRLSETPAIRQLTDIFANPYKQDVVSLVVLSTGTFSTQHLQWNDPVCFSRKLTEDPAGNVFVRVKSCMKTTLYHFKIFYNATVCTVRQAHKTTVRCVLDLPFPEDRREVVNLAALNLTKYSLNEYVAFELVEPGAGSFFQCEFDILGLPRDWNFGRLV